MTTHKLTECGVCWAVIPKDRELDHMRWHTDLLAAIIRTIRGGRDFPPDY